MSNSRRLLIVSFRRSSPNNSNSSNNSSRLRLLVFRPDLADRRLEIPQMDPFLAMQQQASESATASQASQPATISTTNRSSGFGPARPVIEDSATSSGLIEATPQARLQRHLRINQLFFYRPLLKGVHSIRRLKLTSPNRWLLGRSRPKKRASNTTILFLTNSPILCYPVS